MPSDLDLFVFMRKLAIDCSKITVECKVP